MDLILDMPVRDGGDDDLDSLLTEGTEAPADEVCRPLPGEAFRYGVDVTVGSSIITTNGDGFKSSSLLRSLPIEGRPSKGFKYNKILNRLPSDHWKEDGNEFRQVEEKKRAENLQQAVMDCNDNDWTHTKLFFSHCW